MFMPRLCAMAELDECIEYELSTCLAPQSDDLFGFGSFGSFGTSRLLQLSLGTFSLHQIHFWTHIALRYFPHIDYRHFRHLAATLEFWVKLQGRNLKLYSAWACDPSSDLQLLLPRIWSDSLDFYGFLGGPVAWSELDAQRRLSGAEDSFVLFVYIECL